MCGNRTEPPTDPVNVGTGPATRNARFREKQGSKWQRRSLEGAPRSVYLLRGPARTEREHNIPEVDACVIQ